MRNLLVALSLFIANILCFNYSYSQAFSNKSTSLSVGYGTVTFLGLFTSTFDDYSDVRYTQTGPIYFKLERAVDDHIGIALNFAYVKNNWSYSYESYNYNNYPVVYTEVDSRSSISIMARLNIHILKSKIFDPYFGFGLGYRNDNWSTQTNDPYGTSGAIDDKPFPSIPIGFEFTFGSKFMILPYLGAYVEIGAAKSAFQGGLVLNLPGNEQ